MIAGLTIAAVVIAHADDKEVRFDQAALLPHSSLVLGEIPGSTVLCGWSIKSSKCFEDASKRGVKRSVLWFGNSQVPTINEHKAGQTTGVPALKARLAAKGLDLTVLVEPNASLQEHFVAYAHARQNVPVTAVVVSLVFDDTRETGLREHSSEGMDEPDVIARLSKHPIGRRIVERYRAAAAAEEAAKKPPSEQTLQERSEAALTGWLAEHSAVWKAREQANGKLGLLLHVTRNTIFGIKPESKRRLIESRYRDNLEALEAMLIDASEGGIKVLGYIAPLRPGVEVPYIDHEYARFKRDVSALFERHGAVVENLENLVPKADWGDTFSTTANKDREIDFMHFMAPGHQRVAAALGDLVLRSVPVDVAVKL